MAATVGSFGIDFILENAAFVAATRKMTSEINAFTTGVQRSVASARRDLNDLAGQAAVTAAKFAGFAIGAAPAAILALTKYSAELIDEQAKLADRLRVSQDALAGMTLQANLAGVDTESFAKGMDKLNTALGKAAQGGTSQRAALQALGIELKDIVGLPADEKLNLIADRFNTLRTAEEQAVVATTLFGKSGYEMINVLQEGSQAFAAAQEQAERLGLAVSRVDAAQVEAANDALEVAGTAVRGLGNNIAIALSPYVTKLANDFISTASAANGFREEATSGISAVIKTVGFLGDAFRGLKVIGIFAMTVIVQTAQFAAQAIGAILSTITVGIRTTGQLTLWLAETAGVSSKTVIDTLSKVASFDPGALFRKVAEEHELFIEGAMARMRELTQGEIPSESIERWAATARSEARAAAEEIARLKASINQNAGGGDFADPEGDKAAAKAAAAAERERQHLSDSLQNVREHLMTKSELEQNAANKRIEIINAAADAEMITEEQKTAMLVAVYASRDEALAEIKAQSDAKNLQLLVDTEAVRAQMEQDQFATRLEAARAALEAGYIQEAEFAQAITDLAANHQATLTQIHADGEARRTDFSKSEGLRRVSTYLQQAQQMTAGMAQHSRAMFEINKAAALANAIVNLPAAVSAAFKWGTEMGGPYVGAAFAALAAAQQIAQIAAIKKSSFAGGGGGTTPSAIGGSAVVNGNPVNNLGTTGPQDFDTRLQNRARAIDVTLEGNVFSAEGVRSLVEKVTEALGDNVGGKIILRGT